MKSCFVSDDGVNSVVVWEEWTRTNPQASETKKGHQQLEADVRQWSRRPPATAGPSGPSAAGTWRKRRREEGGGKGSPTLTHRTPSQTRGRVEKGTTKKHSAEASRTRAPHGVSDIGRSVDLSIVGLAGCLWGQLGFSHFRRQGRTLRYWYDTRSEWSRICMPNLGSSPSFRP